VAWIPIGAWAAAGLIALVVLGFCGYEIAWKSKRLRSDLQRLNELAAQTQDLRAELAATQQRIAASGLR
jgi:hypothetical protein